MSIVLVDTSIWIDFFSSPDLPESIVVDELLADGLVCTTGLIKAEVVPVARTAGEYRQLREFFDALPLVAEGDGFWEDAIRYQYLLKRGGVYKVSIPDLVIATVALRNDKAIYTKDGEGPLCVECWRKTEECKREEEELSKIV